MDIDKLFSMSSEELDELLETEVEKVIQSAPPQKRERLRAIHSRARLAVMVAKNPTDAMIRTHNIMMRSFLELNMELQNISGAAE